MSKLIPRLGDGRLESRGDAFTTLARSIVGQQISVKAAQAVWERFVALTARPVASPRAARRARARRAEHPRRRAVGAQGRIPAATWPSTSSRARCTSAKWRQMDDEAIIEELVGIRGIGRWTAEMFLIFNLLRPNVLPLDDLGLIKGISVNYFSGEPVSRSEAREVGDAWEPLRSVATWYIWRSLDPLPVSLLTDAARRSRVAHAKDTDDQKTLPRVRAADRRARGQDRRAALRAERVGGRHLRRDRPPRARRASSSPRTSTRT